MSSRHLLIGSMVLASIGLIIVQFLNLWPSVALMLAAIVLVMTLPQDTQQLALYEKALMLVMVLLIQTAFRLLAMSFDLQRYLT